MQSAHLKNLCYSSKFHPRTKCHLIRWDSGTRQGNDLLLCLKDKWYDVKFAWNVHQLKGLFLVDNVTKCHVFTIPSIRLRRMREIGSKLDSFDETNKTSRLKYLKSVNRGNSKYVSFLEPRHQSSAILIYIYIFLLMITKCNIIYFELPRFTDFIHLIFCYLWSDFKYAGCE